MTNKVFSCRLAVVAAIVLAVALAPGLSEAFGTIEGTPLADEEMAQLRGGFLTPSGNFIYFGMEFMQTQFLAHNDPGNLASGTFINALHQQAAITKDGMAVDLQVLQGGGQANQANPAAYSIPVPKTAVTSNIMNNSGLLNTNITVGNFNTSAITNLINVHVGFFNIQNTHQARSVLGNWLGY